MNALTARGLTVTFGGNHAVNNVNLEIPNGKMVGLIGPNGAGKTTTIDALSGFIPSKGIVELDGEAIHALPAHRRVRQGLSRTFQAQELFDDLTVRENLVTAHERSHWWSAFTDLVLPPDRTPSAVIEAVSTLFSLESHLDQFPDELSLGEQKLVSVARGVVAGPRYLLLDEPAAGLDTEATRELAPHLRRITEQGIGVLLIDHDMGLVLSACDYIYVLDFGKVIAQGTPAEIRKNPAVITAYLGKQETSAEPVEGCGVALQDKQEEAR